MEQNTNKFTPSTVGNLEFSIPLYQRLFEWETSQINQLLNDLYENFEQNEPENKPYYIGMFTVYNEKNNNQYSLVDGQQRFTVLTLMAIAFKTEEWLHFLKINDNPRLSFFARKKDTDYLKYKIDGLSDPLYENVKMANGIKTITDFIENSERVERKKEFINYIYNKATFFISELPKNYQMQDLNRYFEAMNATGRGLENHEILKVEILKKVPNDKKVFYTKIWNAISEMDKCLIRQKTWSNEGMDVFNQRRKEALFINSIDDLCKKCNDLVSFEINDNIDSIKNIAPSNKRPDKKLATRNERAILSFTEFLLQVLWLQITQEEKSNSIDFFNTNKLLQTFKLYLNENKASTFIDNLLRYRVIFDHYILRISHDEQSITNYFINYTEDETEENKKLIQFQSMLYVSISYYLWLTPLLNEIKENCNNSKDFSLLEFLKNWDNERLKNKSISLNYRLIDRYWFWRLDYYFWENRKNWFKDNKPLLDIADKYLFKANRSIEHISPQTIMEGDTRRISDEKLDTFGNLVMISSGQNSSLQNESFEVKKAHIKEFITGRNGTIESLKMLHIYNYDTWNDENLNNHNDVMVSILINSFSDNYIDIKKQLNNFITNKS
ncbi:DUF262 domain-containing protein [Flavobacterium branchiophilum]|uniref:DUF262 domain-containing protein n=1 Tax=Flavobacterium branchiophilum (strain FL-15) TaxID=1034807 RepID=G2Z1R7_FLABF|nr:DUF262 domain-containing protein [Flavobacterium branchiophilum]CCB69852.1 Hypothetical protein FBFL15_1795 [Flavobacterium branchiophilum FL-15]